MLSTAMKAPSVAPMTAIQVFAEIAGVAGAIGVVGALISEAEAALKAGWSAVIGISSRLAEAGCIRRRCQIIEEKMEGLSGLA
jgi:hypothetical protein